MSNHNWYSPEGRCYLKCSGYRSVAFEKKNCFRNRKGKCFGGDESDKESEMLKVFWKGGR